MAKKNTTPTRKIALPTLPSLNKLSSKSLAPCICGCGGQTQSEFVAGHDGRTKGLILRLTRKRMTMDQIEEMHGTIGRAIVRGLERMMSEGDRMERWGIGDEVTAYLNAEAEPEEIAEEEAAG